MKKGCKICHAVSLELDSSGRCGSCAAVFRTIATGESYGQLMARRYDEGKLRAKTVEVSVKPKKKAAEPTIRKVCAYCGTEFMAISDKKKYCSATCKRDVWRQNYGKKKRDEAEKTGGEAQK